MRLKPSFMALAVCVSMCAFSMSAPEAQEVEIVRAEGSAEVHNADGRPGPAATAGARVPPGSTISTGENGKVIVKLRDSGFAVLDNRSKLQVNRAGNGALGALRQVTGWIYYALARTGSGARQVQVQTPTAVLGIRGTRFLVVVQPHRNEVGMRKGSVSVESPEGEFELNRTDERAEFDGFKEQGRAAIEKDKAEFQKYQEATKAEFLEYTRQFTLRANRQAVFDGRKVREGALSAELQREMEAAEFHAREWLDRVID